MLNKICTDLKTSKKLKELGIEEETFFYWWFYDFDEKYHLTSDHSYVNPRHLKNKIKAYTLEQIMKILPQRIVVKDSNSFSGETVLELIADQDSVYYDNALIHDSPSIYIEEDCNNLATTAAKLLIKLKEDKII